MNIELAMNMTKNPFQNTACEEYSDAKMVLECNDKKIVYIKEKIDSLKAEVAKLEGK